MLQSMGSQRVGHAQVTEQRTESGLWVPNPEVSPYCRGQAEAMPEWSTGWRRPRGQKNPSEARCARWARAVPTEGQAWGRARSRF